MRSPNETFLVHNGQETVAIGIALDARRSGGFANSEDRAELGTVMSI